MASSRHSDKCRQFRSQRRHLYWLIYEGLLQAKRSGLQRETLTRAAC